MTPPFSLLCHPASTCSAVSRLTADAQLHADGSLRLRYQLHGTPAALLIPAKQSSAGFADGLWQHTCFEAFIAHEHGTAYREFNFSPSGHWAAYAFSDYRQRSAWPLSTSPHIEVQAAAESFVLHATLPAALLSSEPGMLHLGLSAVIETREGALSYWALAHPGERPDFHLRSAFVLHLAPEAP